ncbi:thiamine pyrophosphate-binding protein [Natrarchaeobius halalkaliphilus]|uniref:Thiamine pyrophosphate-binding protein n=1 Tax=Natrarchaeobius halalkaliphilus TaxID=1679091 RepID=A0A3N6P0H8_9EURY|nr:thiamine pyrophosphate-binding protein [Natrarchaeobius halalkaliphilus]RQG87988.1 thiamine pyrophosphate-binding protein [Natrarchaeobius halalkaliphilus]
MSDNRNQTGADLVTSALEEYGVSRIFGNPGTTELPLLRSLSSSDMEYVLGLHEDIAVGMAAGYASTRRYHAYDDDSILPLGVANLHVGPGTAHGLGNLQNAMVSGVPLLVTAGNHSTDFQHEEPILSGDLEGMAREYTKWSTEVSDIAALPTVLRRAVRVALTPPTGPVFVSFPMDVLMAETDADPERLGPIPTLGVGDSEQLDRAAEALIDASDPAIVLGDWVGRSGSDAVSAAVDLAEASGAPVYGELITCEVNFPHDHPQWISALPPVEDMARRHLEADTLVLVGTHSNTTYIPHDTPLIDAETTCVQINPEAWEVGKNVPADVAVVGDPGEAMATIASQVDDGITEATRRSRIDRVAERRNWLDAGGDSDGTDASATADVTKARLVDSLRDAAPDAFVVNESNTSKYPLIEGYDFQPEQWLSNKNGGLGYGLPASLGAAVAWSEHPDSRSVVGFVGDGSFWYYPQSIYTAVRYGLDVTVVVPNNRSYHILKEGMTTIYGGSIDDHEYVGMDFEPEPGIAANARSHGAVAEHVQDLADLDSTLDEAVTTEGPVVVDVSVSD